MLPISILPVLSSSTQMERLKASQLTDMLQTRSWVIQEFLLSPRLTFISHNICLNGFMVEYLHHLVYPTLGLGLSPVKASFTRLLSFRAHGYQDPTLYVLIEEFAGAYECEDFHDHIYTLLGIIGDEEFHVDYRESAEILCLRVLKYCKSPTVEFVQNLMRVLDVSFTSDAAGDELAMQIHHHINHDEVHLDERNPFLQSTSPAGEAEDLGEGLTDTPPHKPKVPKPSPRLADTPVLAVGWTARPEVPLCIRAGHSTGLHVVHTAVEVRH